MYVVGHIVLLYSPDWTNACISFILQNVNLFRIFTLISCEIYMYMYAIEVRYKLYERTMGK